MSSTTDINSLQAVFEKALLLDDVQQKQFIQESFPDNNKDINKVLSMLACATSDEDPIQEVVGKIANELGQNTSLIGYQIDKFQLTQLLGHGGMGEVYLAERIDDEYQQTVAIKIIREELKHLNIHEHFQKERQILADLNHPNICRLLDGGTTSEGLIYLVMEYIEGTPITEYCQKNQLTLKQQLILFLKVCRAVQAAHQSLIIHCDIKPANILVTKDGVPKLLDFGIANLASSELEQANDNLKKAITYAHASPEAIGNKSLRIESDVFSLGILFYELVAGQHPNHMPQELMSKLKVNNAAKNDEYLLKQIQENILATKHAIKQEPLSWIYIKSTRFIPQERYQTVNELIDDIHRYLDRYPVRAQPRSITTTLYYWIQRQYVLATATIVIVALIMVWGLREKNLRQLAETESLKHQKTTEFLVELFKGADPHYNKGQQLTAIELLDKGKESLDINPNLDHVLDTAIKQTIAKAYEALSEHEHAETLYQESLNRELNASDINWHKTAELYSLLGDNARKDSRFEASRTWQNNALQSLENINGISTVHSRIYNNFGVLELDTAHYEQAKNWLTKARDAAIRYPEKLKERLTAIEHNLALTYNLMNQLEMAISIYQKVLVQKEEIFGKKHPRYLSTFGNLVNLYQYLGDQRTESSLEELFSLSSAIYAPGNIALLQDKSALAAFYSDTGKYQKAEEIHLDIIRIMKESNNQNTVNYALFINNLAVQYIDTERFEEAEELTRKSLEIRAQFYAKDHPRIGTILNNMALIFINLERYSEAEALLLRAKAIFEAKNSEIKLVTSLLRIAKLKLLSGKAKDAHQIHNQVESTLRESELPEAHSTRVTLLADRARVALKVQNFELAMEYINRCIGLANDSILNSPLDIARFQLVKADILLQIRKPEQAKEILTQVRPILEAHLLDNSPSLAYTESLIKQVGEQKSYDDKSN